MAPLGQPFGETGSELNIERYTVVSATHRSLMDNLEKRPDRPHTIRTWNRRIMGSDPVGLHFSTVVSVQFVPGA